MNDNDEKDKMTERFRCHYSVVIENVFKKLWLLIVFAVTILVDEIEPVISYIRENGFHLDEEMKSILLAVGILFGIILLVFIVSTLQWAKTYITITDKVIIIEKNTLVKTKKTIGIQNISNVNTERNIFERMVGTCKVKLDTNSASTADKTDVNIILKINKAEEFEKKIVSRMKALEGEKVAATVGENGEKNGAAEETFDDISAGRYGLKEEDFDFVTETRENIMHGVYSLSVSEIIAGILFFGSFGYLLYSVLSNPGAEDFVSKLGIVCVQLFLSISFIASYLKRFFMYYHFRARRVGDKIHLSYGYFKKVNYTMPVDKINVVTIKQSLIARICKKYTVEVVNIGMGNEEGEKMNYLLPYLSEEKMRGAMQVLFPECEIDEFRNYDKQPKSCIVGKIMKVTVVLLVALVGALSVYLYGPAELAWYILGAGAAVWLWLLLVQFLAAKNEGVFFGEDYVKLVTGAFARRYKYIPYEKIQYVEYHQGPLMRRFQTLKADVHVLAALASQEHGMPYFAAARAEEIKMKLLESKKI